MNGSARRLVRMASEDIGLGNPHALPQAVAAYQATQLIGPSSSLSICPLHRHGAQPETTLTGMPECDCILAQVVVMLCESPKSVRVYNAYVPF